MKTINFDNSFAAVLILSVVVALSATEETAQADSFGSGANTFNIDFVTIGNPGNVADTTGRPNPAGSVPYTFRMGQFEISEQMINKANALGGLGITKATRGPNKPATDLNWFEAAKFVNWLNTSTGGVPAYKFDGSGNFQLWTPSDAGYNPASLYRNSQAKYVLPSFDEWYKAAFYDPTSGIYYNYATGSDSVPTAVASGTAAGTEVYNQEFVGGAADITLAGGLSPFGTMAQGGNAWEWEESNGSTDTRDFRGGVWSNDSIDLSSSFAGYIFLQSVDAVDNGISFRVASVSNIPEPSTLLLGAMSGLGLLLRRKH